MSRTFISLVAGSLVAIAIGCTNTTAPGSANSLTSAFSSLPVGFPFVPSTFAGGSAADSDGWSPPDGSGLGRMGSDSEAGEHDGDDDGELEHGGSGLGFGDGSMMCGGLGGAFGGGRFGFGFGFGRSLFGHLFAGTELPGTCAFDAGSGRVVCDTVTHDGLSIARSAAYTTTGGAAQPAFDSLTTNSINLRVSVTGMKVRHDDDTSVVQHSSDRTVSGLAPGSTQRTVNGTSAGHETIHGSNKKGSFTAVRTIGDTISGIVIPVHVDSDMFPTAGTVTRSAQVTLTYAGQSPTMSSRREVVTYSGNGTATIVITQDGTTKTCTMMLPHGKLMCA